MWAAVVGTLLGAVLGYVASVRVAERSHRQSLERDERNRRYDSGVQEFREMRVVATEFLAAWAHFATHLQGDMLRTQPDLVGLHARVDLLRIMAPELHEILAFMLTSECYSDRKKTDEAYKEFQRVHMKVLRRMWPEKTSK